MFGSIVANTDKLSEQEESLYRSCYCGLCRALSERHGNLSRATVNYDMTFLILIFTSLYEYEFEIKTERCPAHPLKKHRYGINEATEYISDMNIVLAYYNTIDDWNDEKKVLSLAEAKILEAEFTHVIETYPEKCGMISKYMEELSTIEKSGIINPDIPANCFGGLMAEVMTYRDDEFSLRLQSFGRAIGKFIYIMDACIDLKKDLKHESYNPMVTTPAENFSSILELLMADCIEKYEALEIESNRGLIENILYSGIWTKWEMHKMKEKRADNDF